MVGPTRASRPRASVRRRPRTTGCSRAGPETRSRCQARRARHRFFVDVRDGALRPRLQHRLPAPCPTGCWCLRAAVIRTRPRTGGRVTETRVDDGDRVLLVLQGNGVERALEVARGLFGAPAPHHEPHARSPSRAVRMMHCDTTLRDVTSRGSPRPTPLDNVPGNYNPATVDESPRAREAAGGRGHHGTGDAGTRRHYCIHYYGRPGRCSFVPMLLVSSDITKSV